MAGRIETYSFVDVGAGKGRALFLAAELPFRKIIGVELNPDLARVAQRNLAEWRRVTRAKSEKRIRIVQRDALEFRWPRTPLFVYLYNPFDCSLVAQLAAKLAAARSASPLVDLLYVNPTCSDTLKMQGLFTRLWTAQIPMDQHDRKADPYGTSTDSVSLFRRIPWGGAAFSRSDSISPTPIKTNRHKRCGLAAIAADCPAR